MLLGWTSSFQDGGYHADFTRDGENQVTIARERDLMRGALPRF
jgi:hypothetical protein